MSQGYNIFSLSSIPNAELALEILYNLYKEKLKLNDYKNKMLKNKLLFNLLEENDYKKHPELNDFILNDLFIKSATKYLQHIPILASVQLWLSVNNHEIVGSQKWHIDGEDKKQIKFFIPITDINMETGPTHFVDKKRSKKILNSLGKKRVGDVTGRISDSLINQNNIIIGLLKKFQCLALDTCNCIHMGSRIKSSSGHRLLLMIQFLPANSHRESSLMPPQIQLNKKNNSTINRLILDII